MDANGVDRPPRRHHGRHGLQLHAAIGGNKDLFDNWMVQLQAMVKEERNHPSIFAWSIENELTLINARNLGQLDRVEPRITRAAKMVMAMDPTRPAMIDGGNCLRDQSLPVNGSHYIEGSITAPGIALREYPDQAYTWEKIIANEKQCFPLALDRPILMGECFFMSGFTPGEMGQFGGEGCFAGVGPSTQRGGGLFAKMMTEGFRWHGIAGWEFCSGSGEFGNMHCNSQKPVALFCRQWNWTFGSGGSESTATLKLFNDTRFADPIDAAWQLRVGGKPVAGERQTFALAPCEHREFDVCCQGRRRVTAAHGRRSSSSPAHAAARRSSARSSPCRIIDPNAGPKPAVAGRSLAGHDLVVLDPLGSVKATIAARGIAFTEVRLRWPRSPSRPGSWSSARTPSTPAKPPIRSGRPWPATGLRCWSSTRPIRCTTRHLPTDIVPTDFVGRVAFEENTEHPIFKGLEQDDFFTWAKDHIVYRNVYTKPTRGATSLAHCDKELGFSAIAECPVNDGLLLLCQMVVGEKLDFEPAGPAALRQHAGLLRRLRAGPPRARPSSWPKSSPALKLLRELRPEVRPLPATCSDGHRRRQAPGRCLRRHAGGARIAGRQLDKVRAFTAKGGWLMAWGLAPDGLASFNKLVGVEHVLRPFEMETSICPPLRDPLLSGLSVRDVAMESTEQMYRWAADKYMVDDEFTWIVDFDDIAPFCEFPGAKAGDHAAARKAQANWPRNVVNGFTHDLDLELLHGHGRAEVSN